MRCRGRCLMGSRAWRRGEERLTPLLAGVLLLLVACNAKRERAEERVMAADSAWHLQAWGIPRSEDDRIKRKRELDCVWEAVARAGGDQQADFECLARKLETGADCFRANQGRAEIGSLCDEQFKSICTTSAAFDSAAKACR